jgi:hypothetical protein
MGLHLKTVSKNLSHKFALLICKCPAPSDDVLKEALLKYTRQGQSREDQLTSLHKDFGYILRCGFVFIQMYFSL